MADQEKRQTPYPHPGSGGIDSEASTTILDDTPNKNDKADQSEQQLENLRDRAIETQTPISDGLLAALTTPAAAGVESSSGPAAKASTEARLNPQAQSFQPSAQPTAVLDNTLNPVLAKYQALADAQENLKAVQKRYGEVQQKLVAIDREVEEAKRRVEEAQAEVLDGLRSSLTEMKVLTGEAGGEKEGEGEQNDEQGGEQYSCSRA